MNLSEIMQAAQGGQGVDNLAAQFGLSPEQTQAAIQAVIPAFSKGLQGATQDPSGLGGILSHLASGAHEASYTDPGQASAASSQGGNVLGQIFGSSGVTGQISQQASRISGVDPAIMGTGPIPASRLALKKAGWSADELDLIEANEAFAAQACAVGKDLGFDPDKLNVNGGAIALGHPIGATGAVLIGTVLDELERRDQRRALVTMCAAGGMAPAIIVERP